MDNESGLNVSQGGTAMICGWNPYNATAGNVAKAALLSTISNLKLGSKVLQEQSYLQTEIVLSGGLTKTPECGQIVTDVFGMPVTLLDSAKEGCAWGPYCWPGTGLKDATAPECPGLTFCSLYP
jgi:sugar (pentulose or hexulose) kinase